MTVIVWHHLITALLQLLMGLRNSFVIITLKISGSKGDLGNQIYKMLKHGEMSAF